MGRLTPPPVTPYPPMARDQCLALRRRSRWPARCRCPHRRQAATPRRVSTRRRPPPFPSRPPPPAVRQARAAAGSAFRETLWFKKGDVEHMIAEARAKMAAQGARPGAVEGPEVPVEEVKPIEDRYKDDGSVTTEDRKKFSLRTGWHGHGAADGQARHGPGRRHDRAGRDPRGLGLAARRWCWRWRRSWCIAVVAVVGHDDQGTARARRRRPRLRPPRPSPRRRSEAATRPRPPARPRRPPRTTQARTQGRRRPSRRQALRRLDKRATRRKNTGARKRK